MQQAPLNKAITFDPNNEAEQVVVIELREDGSAVAQLKRFPAYTMTISAAIVAGRDLHVGDVLTVRGRKPEHFGFRNASREWTALDILETKAGRS